MLEHGVTFADSDEDAFNLNTPIAGVIKDASVKGNQLVLRSMMGYAAASRAVGGGAKAFDDALKFLVANMMRSASKKLEIELLYGQMGYGTVASIASNTITITTAEWAPGIWAGGEKMPIDIYSSVGVLRGTANLTAVDMDARSITVDAMPAGVVATDVIWHKGAYGKEFAGIHKIITNTSTLFGINPNEFNLWKGNSLSASNAALSLAKILDGISRQVEKGLEDDVIVLVNPRSWSDLLAEQTALRQYDSSYSSSSVENGSKAIKFYGQNGSISVIPSIYVKEGYAYSLYLAEFFRIGSSDLTFNRPGKGDEFFMDKSDSAAYELRLYTDQALFTHSPGKNLVITNIVNS